MAYEAMTGMINLEELEIKANEIHEVSGAREASKFSNVVFLGAGGYPGVAY